MPSVTSNVPKSACPGATHRSWLLAYSRLFPTRLGRPAHPTSNTGDPTVFGNLPPSPLMAAEVTKAVTSGKFNGYTHSCGYPASRQAVADSFTTEAAPLKGDDVILTSGCSGALEIAIKALVNPGQTILLPTPGFPLYETIAVNAGITVKHYNLLSDKNWEVDIPHLESLIDSTTGALLINNPSNPCGSNFSKEHLNDIIKVADGAHIPIISDEIYANMVFKSSKAKFYSAAHLTSTVPILVVGGLAKRFLVPGWRMGWILIHDRNDLFKEVRGAILRLTTVIIGSNTLVQAILPVLLKDTPQEFFDSTLATLEENSTFLASSVKECAGLQPVVPQGAMYMMVRLDARGFAGLREENDNTAIDIVFTQRLLSEEGVFVLPGSAFTYPNYIRLVVSAPKEMLEKAMVRMADFCKRHFVPA
eukprot:TRINITY_DN3284_c0_g1_i2.p1 TRINITY_DN3284_c0_g1~~TRINITY_DN3284_c0_g1_i2.p1  ORF type:complete len:419 (+),score=67.19 TRINITY_DN3284_c0_g1_i2:71-1327(+)